MSESLERGRERKKRIYMASPLSLSTYLCGANARIRFLFYFALPSTVDYTREKVEEEEEEVHNHACKNQRCRSFGRQQRHEKEEEEEPVAVFFQAM